eukprot:Tamp_08657.p1 GENE.Tamp_08657~~Tamp_08657.p1  ORF type:complete len:722 (-),score=157.63 Tamp_08657:129-2210(-)
MPATAPARTFGSAPAARASADGPNGHHEVVASYAGSARRPASPGPAAYGSRGAAPLVGNHALNASKNSSAASEAPAWIPPNAKNASPAVAAALGVISGRGRNPSPVAQVGLQRSAPRSSSQDLKFARMAAGLTSNTSGVEKVDSPEKILESLSASPSSRSSPTASPQKAQQPRSKPRAAQLEPAREALPLEAPNAHSHQRSPPQRRGTVQHGEDWVKTLEQEMNGKMERLYECHVRGMEVIAQQQALLATLHRDLRIVKSAVTYMNAKINGVDPVAQADAHEDPQTSQMAEQLQDSIADLVEARHALVTAMRWADTAQQNKGNQDFLKFKEQLEGCGLLSAPSHAGGDPSLGLRRAAPAPHAASRGDDDERLGGGGGFTHDSPPAARTSKMAKTAGGAVESAARRAPGGHGGGPAGSASAFGRAPSQDDEDAGLDGRVRAESGAHAMLSPGSADAHSSRQHASPPDDSPNSHTYSPHRAASPPQPAPQTPAKSALVSSPVAAPGRNGVTPAKSGVKRGGSPAQADKGRSPSNNNNNSSSRGRASPRGGSVAAASAPVPRFAEDVVRAMEECVDETADELVTTRLALRNMVKLSRMAGCSKEKVDEYRRLLEECAVMQSYDLPPSISQVQHLRGQEGTPQMLETVLDAVSDLNTAKLALRKMMGLMENPDVSREMLDKYVSMIEETLLAQQPSE